MRTRGLALLVVVALFTAACGNADDDDDDAGPTTTEGADEPVGDRTGVTDDEIKVGGVASITNPLGGNYQDAFVGAKAYFDKVNAEGGVHGRTINLLPQRDDRIDPNENTKQVRELVEKEKVFAVLPIATLFFGGGQYLADQKVPTFGWNINKEWSLGPNLFGEKGSFLCFDCGGPFLPWLAKQAGATKVAVLAYNVPQSAECAEGQEKSFQQYGEEVGVELAFVDKALGYGFAPGDLAPDIDRIRSEGVDFLTTCVDGAGSGRIARALSDAQLDVTQYLPNGYDPEFLEEYGDVLEGSFVATEFMPFEEPEPSEGLQEFLDAMEEAGKEPNENALAGWVNAHLFVTAIEEAGENFSRESVIETINAMTDYTADGIYTPIDWTIAHERNGPVGCNAVLQITDGELVPVFGEEGKPFVCLEAENPDFDDPEIR